MRLLLIRHGNTFGPKDRVVWVGRTEDLPLVQSGRDQATQMGEVLKAQGLVPDRFIAGSLQRAQGHARLIMRTLGLSGHPETDARLAEIDYGPWGGLSENDIEARYGADALKELELWGTESRWPTLVEWSPSEAELKGQVHAMAQALKAEAGADDLVCLVSSNGVLRYFLDLLPGGLASRIEVGDFKMKTGAASLIDWSTAEPRLVFWNKRAADLSV